MRRIVAMFLPLIVKWVVGEHLLFKIENGVGEDEKGGWPVDQKHAAF